MLNANIFCIYIFVSPFRESNDVELMNINNTRFLSNNTVYLDCFKDAALEKEGLRQH